MVGRPAKRFRGRERIQGDFFVFKEKKKKKKKKKNNKRKSHVGYFWA
jgi:hypothetical protein